jgi:hypothetical protein
MSKIVDAARNLPRDPQVALVTFAERAIIIHKSTGNLDAADAEFILSFVSKFSKKFDILVNFERHPGQKNDSLTFQILNEINGDLKPKLLSEFISSDVEEVMNEFLDGQGRNIWFSAPE